MPYIGPGITFQTQISADQVTTDKVFLDDGLESAPSFTFSDDTNNGIFSPTNDSIAITTNGTEKLRINSSGNIGVGTDTPATLIDIYGEGQDTVQISLRQWNDNSGNGLDGPDIRFFASGGTIASPAEMDDYDVIGKVNAFAYNGTNSSQYGGFGWRYQTDGLGGSGSSFEIETKSVNESTNSAKIYISEEGAVGIGTTSPISVNLQINGFYNSGTSEYGAPTQYFYTNLSSVSAGQDIGRIIFARNGDSATINAKSTGTGNETDLFFYTRNSGSLNSNPTLKLYHDETAEFAGDLTINGDITITASAPVLFFNESDASTDNKIWTNYASSEELIWQSRNDSLVGGGNLFKMTRTGTSIDTFKALNAGNTWLTIDNTTKRVGIGTSPRGEIDIYQPTGQASTIFIEGGSSEIWFKDVDETSIFRQIINTNGWNVQPGTGSVASPTWSGVALTIDENGNIGAGTESPSSKLDVRGATNLIRGAGDPALNITSNYSYIRDISDGTGDGGHGIIQLAGPDGSYVISVQDGYGRVQHRWNSTTGTTPTRLVGGENSGYWEYDASSPASELFAVYYDNGVNSLAGDAILWNSIFNVGHDEIVWGGNADTATTTTFDRWSITNDQDTSTSSGYTYMQIKGNSSDRSTFRIVGGDNSTEASFRIDNFSGGTWDSVLTLFPSDKSSTIYDPAVLRLNTYEPSVTATTAEGDAYGSIEFAVNQAEINDSNSVAQTLTDNVIAAIKAIDWRGGSTTNEDAGIGFYTTQVNVASPALTFRGGFSNDGGFYVGSNVDQANFDGKIHVEWDRESQHPYGFHLVQTTDDGEPDAMALTNMYDRDIGIALRSGDSNGANQATRWLIWNDAANTGDGNNRLNISPTTNAARGITILQNDNVGISKGLPEEKLHVNGGNILIEHNAPFFKYAETGVTGSPVFWTGMDSGNYSIRLNNTAPYPFIIGTKGTNNDAIDFVSIGGESEQNRLRVTAHTGQPTYVDITANASNTRVRFFETYTERMNMGYDASADIFNFNTSSGARFVIADDGYASIGNLADTNPTALLQIGTDDHGGLTWPTYKPDGTSTFETSLKVDGYGGVAIFAYNNQQSDVPVAVFAKGNEAQDNQVVIIAGDGDGNEELLDIRSSGDPPNTSGLLTFGQNNSNSKFRVYGDGRVYTPYRIGIGTTNPGYSIESYGDLSLRSPDSNDTANTKIVGEFSGAGTRNTYLRIGANTNRRASIVFSSYDVATTTNTDQWSIGRGDNDEVSESSFFIATGLSGGNTSKFNITSGGNVGIGTTNPQAKLHVYGAAALIDPAGNTTAGDQYDSMVIGDRAANDGYVSLTFKNGSNFSSKIDSTQNNWSVWTNKNSSAGARIEANWGTSTATETLKLRPGNTDVLVAYGNGRVVIDDAEIWPNNHIEVGRGSGSVAMTINDGYGNANIAFNHRDGVPDNTSTGQSAGRIECSVDNVGARMQFELKDSTSNGTTVGLVEVLDLDIGLVEVTGDLDVSGTLSQNTSDGRLKENLVRIPNPLDKVDQLHGYTFDWKAECADLGFTPKIQTNDIGLIAQDVQAVMPQAVTPAPFDHELSEDGTEDISISGENYLTVQYERLVPLLVEAIKELRQEVETLKSQISGS